MLKNLTISDDPNIIAKARAKAAAEHTTLNDLLFRNAKTKAHINQKLSLAEEL